jgi:hypothetical protein
MEHKMVNVNEALTEMHADPESFLRHHLVMIAGGGSGVVPQKQATFTMKVGDNLFQGFQTGISGKVGLTKQRNQLRIMKVPDGTIAEAGAAVFRAWYIPMTEMSGSGGGLAHHVTLAGSDGPDIALTSQMSGCTFGLGSAAPDGSRFVAHIKPPSGPPNTEAYASMRNDASLGTMDAFFERPSRPGDRSYGNPRNRATIIGVRHANQWRFYAQTYNLDEKQLFKVEPL